MSPRIIISKSIKETHLLAKALLNRGVRIFALTGNLGSGKTTFAQGVAKALGIRRRITSPTFIIMNHHKIPRSQLLNFYHIDTYRLHSGKELKELGLPKILKDKNNIVVIEWAEKVKRLLPKNATRIHFSHHKDSKKRVIKVIGN